MQERARAAEGNQQAAAARGAEGSAPRATPLTLVSGAIAGDHIEDVAATVADALGRVVAIVIPALAAPVVLAPPGALTEEEIDALTTYAKATVAGAAVQAPSVVTDSVSIRIGDELVGIAAAGPVIEASNGHAPEPPGAAERRAWLEAVAAAASVTTLIHESHNGTSQADAERLLLELAAGGPEDLADFLARARRAGLDLSSGGIVLCARREGAIAVPPTDLELAGLAIGTVAGRVLILAPTSAEAALRAAAGRLRDGGFEVALSAPRREPAGLGEAIREAELLSELAGGLEGQLETYRLLIGVLLRDPDELRALRAATISPLIEYDRRHDTDLLATLRGFLVHDGSTTDTAEAMELHRHTVGYRLSRVHEVSGLSPYETDGRERLSLGLKAHQILAADARLEPPAASA